MRKSYQNSQNLLTTCRQFSTIQIEKVQVLTILDEFRTKERHPMRMPLESYLHYDTLITQSSYTEQLKILLQLFQRSLQTMRLYADTLLSLSQDLPVQQLLPQEPMEMI